MARQRERRTQALYALSRELAACATPREVARPRARATSRACSHGEAAVLLPGRAAASSRSASRCRRSPADPRERAVAQWAFDHGQPAGRGTDTLPGARARSTSRSRAAAAALGVLGGRAARAVPGRSPPEQRELLSALARQIAAPLERAQLAAEARAARGSRRRPSGCAARC